MFQTFPLMLQHGKVRIAMTAKIVAFKTDQIHSPIPLNGKVPPKRVPNSQLRSREYLTPGEVDSLMAAAGKTGRHGHRDQTLILIGYRHGLRVSELVALRWEQVDLKAGLLHVNRVKNGTPATHPLRGPELRALRKVSRDYSDSPYVFSSERNGPLTASSVRKIVTRAGECRYPFPGAPAHATSRLWLQVSQ